MRQSFIDLISNKAMWPIVHNEAMAYIKDLTGFTKNCCATKASFWHKHAGNISKIYPMTSDLSDALIKIGCTKITKIEDLRIGDTVFTDDLNHNHVPDHTFLILSDTLGMPPIRNATIIDNYGIIPHLRNLGPGPRTPFAYALRLPESIPTVSVGPLNSFFSNLVEMYDLLGSIGLSNSEKTFILSKMNDIRNSESLKDLKRG